MAVGTTDSPICIAGGGRWARIIAQALDQALPAHSRGIVLQTPHSHEALAAWVADHRFRRPIQVCSDFDDQSGPLIVANAAQFHCDTALSGMSSGRSVLVEKPIAQSMEQLNVLYARARSVGCRLAPAHVFAFAPYIARFAACAPKLIAAVEFVWSDICVADPSARKFDPALSVYADWLPHMISVLDQIQPQNDIRIDGVEASRGGASLRINGVWGGADLTLVMDRQAQCRRRVVKLTSIDGSIHTLDFSDEPGRIIQGEQSQVGDPDWGMGLGPLATMLMAFLAWADEEQEDPRFQPEAGIKVVRCIDACRPLYQKARNSWLDEVLSGPNSGQDPDVYYAFAELLGRRHVPDLLARHLIETYDGAVDRKWLDAALAQPSEVNNPEAS